MTSPARSWKFEKNGRKCRLRRLRVNFTHLSATASSTSLSDMTSLAASCRMQNATTYCTKVRKTGAAGIEVHHSVTVWRKITRNYTLNFHSISADIVKSSGAAFCPAHWWASCLLLLFLQLLISSIVDTVRINHSRNASARRRWASAIFRATEENFKICQQAMKYVLPIAFAKTVVLFKIGWAFREIATSMSTCWRQLQPTGSRRWRHISC